jgi:hypothetical protein
VRIVQLISLIYLFSGCLNEPDCQITNTNLVKIAFKIDSKTPREITFDEITVSGLDDKFYTNARVSTVELPVSPVVPETTITFKFEGRTETMTLTYLMISRVISPDCGAYLYHENVSVKESSFDEESINLISDKLLTNVTVNIEVYNQ